MNNTFIDIQHILLSRIIHFYMLSLETMSKSIYFDTDLTEYKWLHDNNIDFHNDYRADRLLNKVILYSTNEYGWLKLFKPKGRFPSTLREKEQEQEYRNFEIINFRMFLGFVAHDTILHKGHFLLTNFRVYPFQQFHPIQDK